MFLFQVTRKEYDGRSHIVWSYQTVCTLKADSVWRLQAGLVFKALLAVPSFYPLDPQQQPKSQNLLELNSKRKRGPESLNRRLITETRLQNANSPLAMTWKAAFSL